MRFIVIASRRDPAGMNIVENINKLSKEIKTKIVRSEIINAENIDKDPEVATYDFIIFASKHQSEKKVKTLSVHTIGNFETAKFGGKSRTICSSNPLFFKHIFQNLNNNLKKSELDFTLSLEATHHGPYIEKPSLFIEIGSSLKEWSDIRAGKLIAETIIESINNFSNYNLRYKLSIGIGGPHYCPNFNEIQLGDEYAIAHIIPSYNLPIDDSILKETLRKSVIPVSHVLIDWKGLGNSIQRNELLKLLENNGLTIIRTSDAKTN
ncbi:MAG: D-aminoacyl-tRNA deacylase [Candidatus Pacearchaeota archaeon]